MKELELGNIEIIDLSEEIKVDELEGIYMSSDKSLVNLTAQAAYGTTSGCSESCGSSTFCC